MRIALASLECRNNDLTYNMAQIRAGMELAADQGARLICFGETFLQGFDAFNGSYEHDREIAVTLDGAVMQELKQYCKHFCLDLALGYLERDADSLYSSYVLIQEGALHHNFRRISKGWKEWSRTDDHYKEGNEVDCFDYRGKRCLIALCGDLWDMPERFRQGQDLLLWPVYVDFSLEDWKEMAPQYLEKASSCSVESVLINSILKPTGMGGCFHYRQGRQIEALWPGNTGLLLVEV